MLRTLHLLSTNGIISAVDDPSVHQPRLRQSAADRVAEALRDGIRGGRLVPGEHLTESDLTLEYGVSRGSVREAMHRLAGEGLLEVCLNRGAQVRRLTRAEVLDLCEVREVNEGLAARLAAERIDAPGARRAMTALLDAVTAGTGGLDVLARGRENRRFHESILRASGNLQLAEIWRFLETPLLMFVPAIRFATEDMQRSVRDHEAIARAILAGNADMAERAMRLHVRAVTVLVAALPDTAFRPDRGLRSVNGRGSVA